MFLTPMIEIVVSLVVMSVIVGSISARSSAKLSVSSILNPSLAVLTYISPEYRIYSCISRPFMTKNSAQKIALDLYTSHTQSPDQAVREISITTA